METLKVSSEPRPVRYPNEHTFWKEFWHNYCHITHFHGFHEMQAAKDPFNRIFWITAILAGFGFALSLTITGILHFLKDPVDTHVTTLPQGELDFPILYCPENWIDKSQLTNGTDKYLLYALSYLRIPNYVYMPYEYMVPYSMHMPAPRISDYPTFLTNMTSFQMAVYLSDKSPPSFYIGNSRLIMGSIPSLSYLIQWSNDQNKLITDLYPLYLANRSRDLFEHVYYNLTFSYVMARDVYQNVFKDNFAQMTSVWADVDLGRFLDDECFTLNDLDQIDKLGKSYYKINTTDSDWPCHYSNPRTSKSGQNETFWTHFVHKRQKYMKLFNGMIFTRICDNRKDKYCAKNKDEQILRMNLEKKRSERIAELIIGAEKIDYNPKLETKEDVIVKYLDQNEQQFDEELKIVLSKAERKFLLEEKLEFENFLKTRSYGTVLDFLKNVSFDESSFFVSFSMDSKRHIRPNSSKITAKRIVMADGTCILFRIQLDANTVGGWVEDFDNTILNEDDLQYPAERSSFDIYSLSPIKTAYVNIIVRQNANSLFAQRQSSMISFGESAYANSQELFDCVKFPVSFSKYQPTSRYDRFSIESVTNLVEISRSVSPCIERNLDSSYDKGDLPYSYSSCLLSCTDLFTNPKTVCGRSVNGTEMVCRNLASCAFLAENGNIPKNLEPCSIFNLHQVYESWTPKVKIYNVNSTDKTDCFQNCFPPCKSLTFHIQRMQDVDDPADPAEKKPIYSSTLNYIAQRDLKKRNEIIWMPESFFWYISTYADQIYQIDQSPQSRIEIQISTELTTYESQPSFTWDTLFGVVGGQIGLVMGASCLTLVQFVWLFTLSLYKYFAGRSQLVNFYKISHKPEPDTSRPSIIYFPPDQL